MIGAIAPALFLCAAFPLIGASHLKSMTAVILGAGFADTLIAAAWGGLLVTTLSAPAQAKASAWQNAGQLGGGALGGAAVLWLAARLPLPVVGLFVAALVALPAFTALAIPEPAAMPSAWFRGRLSQMGREIASLVRSPERRWSALLVISPAGTAAAQTLLPAIASHYGVGQTGVMWVNGAAGGVVLALGALCGTLIPSDWDRRLTYAGSGLLNALAALVLLATHRPSVYLLGTILYLVTAGLDWPRLTALLVEVVGAETRHASTFYSALNAAATIPLLLMIWLHRYGFSTLCNSGLLWTDAAPNLLIFVIVAIVFATRGLGLRRAPSARAC